MIIPVYDAIHDNIGHLPAGHAAGYVTGSPAIQWTAADWAAHPGAVRIAQSSYLPADEAADADVLDVEDLAATVPMCAPWAKKATAAWEAGTRPGQRHPAIYASASMVTPVVNALKAAGLAGIGLWVANWNLDDPQADALIQDAAGPFPVIGVQDKSFQFYDASVFAKAWLDDVSSAAADHDGTEVHCPAGTWTRLPHSFTEVKPKTHDVVLDVRRHL